MSTLSLVNSLPDYSAYYSPDSLQPYPRRSSNGPVEIILMSMVLGVFFALLAFGMMMLGAWMETNPQQENCGVMCFDEDRLALLLGFWAGLEGAAGGIFASFFLVPLLRRKPLGTVMGRTLLIHSIPVSALGLLFGMELGVFCGLWALMGGSSAITCALVAAGTRRVR